MTDIQHTSTDALLAPFEARPVTLPREEVTSRQRHLSFGWELSRLQGATMTEAWRRLFDLYACGQITRDEYRSVGLALAKSGALTSKEELSSHHGR